MNEPPAARRTIYDEDLQVRIDAAMARTRRFMMSTQAIRASAGPQRRTPFTPYCSSCQQLGRTHDAPPTSEQHYICGRCYARWTVQPSAS